jgi:hypothetical protein
MERKQIVRTGGLAAALEARDTGLLSSAHEAAKPKSGLGLNALANLLEKPEAVGLYYRNQVIPLDGYSFRGCRFDGCKLIVSSSNFELIQCVIDDTTSIEYSTSAAKLVRLFLSKYPSVASLLPPYFQPVKHADGTVSISDQAR